MKTLNITLFLILFSAFTILSADSKEETIKYAEKTIQEYKKSHSQINALLSDSYGYAVFPNIEKGALVIGSAQGDGVVYKKGDIVGYTSLKQFTVGLQLGAQTYSEVIFFKDETAFNNFTEEKLTLGAHASAVATQTGGSSDTDYKDGVVVFTVTRSGLMFEASISGQQFSYEDK